MNIILSSAGFFPNAFGGGQVYVYRLAKELLQQGHKVKVLTPVPWELHEKSTELYIIKNYTYEDIPVISFMMNPDKISHLERNTGYGPLTFNILKKIISEISPELIHINGLKPALVMLCNEMQMPHVVTAHHTGITCPAGGLLRPDNSICAMSLNYRNCIQCCSVWKRPEWLIGWAMGHIPSWVYRPLGRRFNNSDNLSYIQRGLIYPWLIEQSIDAEKIVLEKAQLIIAPSQTMKDLLVRNGCIPSRILVLPHGIEPIVAPPIEDIKNRPVRFGYIGRIDPSKGLHLLLEATEFLRNSSSYEIHIFGAAKNPWDEDYRKKTLSEYGRDVNIIDHGLIPHERISEAYADIDVVIVPSILPEAFGLVVAEAFSAGRPVIVSGCGALTEQVRDGIDGFIIEINNKRALAEAMQKFINKPDLIFEMSIQIPHVKTMQEYVDEIEGIYLNLIQSANTQIIS